LDLVAQLSLVGHGRVWFELPPKTVEIATPPSRADAARHDHRTTANVARPVKLAAVCVDPASSTVLKRRPRS
jgi:hypothetical protein